MRLDTENPGGSFRRAGLLALVAFAALSPASPLLAQTLRFSPTSFNVPSDLNTPASVDIFIDSVPPNGLIGFKVLFVIDTNLINFKDVTLDPNLDAGWNDPPNKNLATTMGGITTWEVHNAGGPAHPTGTVRLGRLRLTGAAGNGDGLLRWDTTGQYFISVGNFSFPNFVDAEFTVGTAQSDLTLTGCQQSSPADPNHFVDGDTITVTCTARNLGPGGASGTTAVTVISSNATVDNGDSVVNTT
ncbi:MAG TPA: hypothetical protein VE404_03610, partial [Verrucomicrobiae bacterium]|nr:hypothetical protein [Verrucomicrobiae bacterium]